MSRKGKKIIAGSAKIMSRHDEKLVLVLNAGSSSLKFALFDKLPSLACGFSGVVDRIGRVDASLMLKDDEGLSVNYADKHCADHRCALELVLEHVEEKIGSVKLSAIGHRVVHSGHRYHRPARVDSAMLRELRQLSALDPEHLPAEMALMESLAVKFPNAPQIACFDTAFHHTMPRVAKLLPIPRRYYEHGVRRYGFHGLSYESLMSQPGMGGRVVLAHLGNGASLAAVLDGKPIDTSMGFSPAAGLPMSTRSGDIDPGLIRFFGRNERMTAEELHQMLNNQSGLLGVSETSSDVRDLLARESVDERAADALALFCYQTKKLIGAFAAALGGLDTLVFSGGIGEHSAVIRARICQGLGFLGLELDEEQNLTSAAVISTSSSDVSVRVIRTDEELIIAQAVYSYLKG